MPPSGERLSLIVVGASAGGVEALSRLAAGLPRDLPAAVAVVLHVPIAGPSVLPAILTRAGGMPAQAGVDGGAIEDGVIYVAPPDVHMLVMKGTLALVRGPRENGHRPAVDPLFSSAANTYGPGVIGVILSGALDDGAAGLVAIKSRHGVAVVQDPDDALYPGMPQNALERVKADHVVALDGMAALLTELVGSPTPPARAMSDHELDPLGDEVPPEFEAGPAMPAGEAIGVSCPECGGALWYGDEQGARRFRCRIGHAYSEQSLIDQHGRSLEVALWTALRALEERAALMRRMAGRARDAGRTRSAETFLAHAHDLDTHAATVREHIVPAAFETEAEVAVGQ